MSGKELTSLLVGPDWKEVITSPSETLYGNQKLGMVIRVRHQAHFQHRPVILEWDGGHRDFQWVKDAVDAAEAMGPTPSGLAYRRHGDSRPRSSSQPSSGLYTFKTVGQKDLVFGRDKEDPIFAVDAGFGARAAALESSVRYENDVKRRYTKAARLNAQLMSLPGFSTEIGSRSGDKRPVRRRSSRPRRS